MSPCQQQPLHQGKQPCKYAAASQAVLLSLQHLAEAVHSLGSRDG